MERTGDSGPEVPSFETLLQRFRDRNGPRPNATTHVTRLCWALQGPLTEAIGVLDTDRNPDVPKEPYCQTVDPVTWHSISQEPLTIPEVSSISVTVDDWEQYEINWLDGHEPHADLSSDNCEFGQLDGEGAETELLRCCGTDRPREIPPLLVKASDKPFVTIHDYVSAVHPWLLSLRDKILWALSDVVDDAPLPAGTRLCVESYWLHRITIMEQGKWVSYAMNSYKGRAQGTITS